MLRINELLPESLFDKVSFEDCQDPLAIKKVLESLAEKFTEAVKPALTLNAAICLLATCPAGAFFIRKSREADALTLSVKTTEKIVHHRFKNKALEQNEEGIPINLLDLFVSDNGINIETVIANYQAQLKRYSHLPQIPIRLEYHKSNSYPIMILSTQYSALREESQTSYRLGGTGEEIQKHIGGGITRMHRDKRASVDDITVLKKHLLPGGLLIITGHGGADSPIISGSYITVELEGVDGVKNHSVSHSVDDYVAMIMQGETLPPGSHLNILLYVCLAATSENNRQTLAEEFANALLKHGVSTAIIATTGIMGRIPFANKNLGDVPGAAMMVRTEVENIRVLITTASSNGELMSQEQRSYTEPFIITPVGCGPRSEIEEYWLMALEGTIAKVENLNEYVTLLVYFMNCKGLEVNQVKRIARAKSLFQNLSNEYQQLILEMIKPISGAIHLSLSALTVTSLANSSSTAFTFKLPTCSQESYVRSPQGLLRGNFLPPSKSWQIK